MTPTNQPRPLRLFLCHSSGDKPAVRELSRRLRADGFAPWLDEDELLPGQDWDREIRQAVRAADAVLVCLSGSSMSKAGYVQKEIRFALDVADEQPEGAIFLIPLKLEPCDAPERLSRWQWANYFEANGYERLRRSLHLRAEKIGTTVSSPSSPRSVPPPSSFTITTPIHLELVRVPAGEFLMGSDPARDKDARPDEQPQHRVYLSEFHIGKYPVTNEQYAAFVRATGQRVPDHWKNGQISRGKANHPVVYVDWADAVAFCEWLSKANGRPFRLPTEAEWEKAARGPELAEGRIYPWGNVWESDRLNSVERGPGDTTPVGHYSPAGDSPSGAADMAGNVWECCADWYDEQEYQRRAGRVVTDPTGPKQGNFHVLRGGAFSNRAPWLRCAARGSGDRNRFRDLGFRVAGGPLGPEVGGR